MGSRAPARELCPRSDDHTGPRDIPEFLHKPVNTGGGQSAALTLDGHDSFLYFKTWYVEQDSHGFTLTRGFLLGGQHAKRLQVLVEIGLIQPVR